MANKIKRYVQVGCGSRGTGSYSIPLVKEFEEYGELCGVYDINYKRAERVSRVTGKDIPVFDDFDKMLEEVKPDAVIITTKDCDHDYYAIKAMRAGVDVISEKPLTTTFEKANELRKVKDETGRDLTVTFNCRFFPFYVRVKEILDSGILGDILSVHLEWLLDTNHGADYFRRWHRERKNSGTLLVHKSTHHFDLVNWWLGQDPLHVNAFGTRSFYGPTRENRGERCLTCPHKKTCEFYLDITSPSYKDLYYDCEDVDGYYRDKCVFSEEIDIEDTVSVNVQYSGGTVLSYSLIAHSPLEGVNITFNGTNGRLEIKKPLRGTTWIDTAKDQVFRIYNHEGEEIDYKIPEKKGGHGGSDGRLLDRLFGKVTGPDPLNQCAGLREGLLSIGIGMAATVSMEEGRQVSLSEFYGDIDKL